MTNLKLSEIVCDTVDTLTDTVLLPLRKLCREGNPNGSANFYYDRAYRYIHDAICMLEESTQYIESGHDDFIANEYLEEVEDDAE